MSRYAAALNSHALGWLTHAESLHGYLAMTTILDLYHPEPIVRELGFFTRVESVPTTAIGSDWRATTTFIRA